jgi:hypothetical protein
VLGGDFANGYIFTQTQQEATTYIAYPFIDDSLKGRIYAVPTGMTINEPDVPDVFYTSALPQGNTQEEYFSPDYTVTCLPNNTLQGAF